MTKLSRKVKRHDDRSGLVVVLYPSGVVGIREAGRRKEMAEPLAYIYSWMCKREAERVIAARVLARKVKKVRRRAGGWKRPQEA